MERMILLAEIKLRTPLCVASGVGEDTDSDVQRDYDGNPYIPGSSLAGAMKAYLSQCGKSAEFLGEDDENSSRMSLLRISDVILRDVKIGTRDGVKLENKLAVDQSKHNYEIIETANGIIQLELTLREKGISKKEEWIDDIKSVLSGFENGEIRLGGNRNRGLGCLKVENVYYKIFSKDNVEDWLDYKKTEKEKLEPMDWYQESKVSIYEKFRVPLKLTGGISIRRYTTKPNEPDYEHITSNGQAIVPGTSWNGAIRQQCQKILEDLGYEKAASAIQEWFGYVDLKDAKQSDVVISESFFEKGEPLIITRNKINRFDASTIEGALYTEKSYFEGETILEIRVRKNVRDFEVICGLLLLVIKDIQKGYLAIGGQTAIGRGIFKAIEGQENIVTEADKEKYAKALYNFVKGEE